MKTLICLLALVAFTAAGEKQTLSVASGLEGVLEDFRDQMPCGFPLLGLGPLAPLSVSEKDVYFDSTILSVVGSVRNLTVDHLNMFDILEVRHSAVKRKLTLRLLFKNIVLNSWYDLKTLFEDYGLTVKVIGSGDAYFALNGFEVSVTIKYGISVLNSRVSLKSLKVVPQIESVESNIEGILGTGSVNKFSNKVLEQRVPQAINTFGESFADELEAELVPRINKFLHQYTLNDLLAGAGGNSAGGQKIKCEV